MRQQLFSSAICLLFCVVPSQAAKRRFTIEDLYRLRTIEGVHLSPDGRMVAFTVITSELAKAKRTKHIWMMDTDGGNARQFTHSEKDESAAVFSADGKWMAFISSRDGDENLYVMPTTGGEAQQLTHISTGVSDPLWVSERKMDRLFERRLSGMRRRRRLQQEDRAALEQGTAPSTHGRRVALPPLD